MLLRVRPVIETDAYYTAELGKLSALRQMYVEGRAGIYDANLVSCRCTLFDGIFRGHIDVVRFLLDSGADPNQEDFQGFTPRNLAFQKIHTNSTKELTEELKTIFAPIGM